MMHFFPRWHVDMHFVLACMVGFWSAQVEMHFLSLLAREGFGQEELRSNFCPRWQGMGLVNACNLGPRWQESGLFNTC